MKDRRRDVRVIEENKVVVSLMTGDVQPGVPGVFRCLTCDISVGGLRLMTAAPLEAGTRVRVDLTLSRSRKRVKAVAESVGSGTSSQGRLRGRARVRRPRAGRRIRPDGPHLRREEQLFRVTALPACISPGPGLQMGRSCRKEVPCSELFLAGVCLLGLAAAAVALRRGPKRRPTRRPG